MGDVRSPIMEGTDPYEREGQIFPRLAPEQVERIAAFGREETLPGGTPVFTRGDRTVDFFLIRSGAIEIFDLDEEGRERVFTTHGERQFTGELDLFNDRKILVSGRTSGETRAIRLARPDFQRMMAGEPDIAETIMRAFILRRVGLIRHAQGGVTLVGGRKDAATIALQRFLTRNGYPHRLLDRHEDADVESMLDRWAVGDADLPVVIQPDGCMLRAPSVEKLACVLGISVSVDPDHVYDLAVVGAGPAGLAAAVYGASEGLDTIIIEGEAPGGQAGTSSKIENYLGFPTGISGQALAGRAQTQAQKFGARLAVPRRAKRLLCNGSPHRIELADGESVQALAVVVATGARYRTLDVSDFERFEGAGVHYAATAMEAALCGGSEVVVVGGGNSAGQAAVFLARQAAHVHILVRSDSLAASMSDYLIQRIDASDKITLHRNSAICELIGDKALEQVRWTNAKSSEVVTRDVANVFVMIGALPNTEWVAECLELDRGGFVVTESGATPFCAGVPGVFAVGDVRSGSTKRVASGVGEGSVVVSAVHRYLAQREEARLAAASGGEREAEQAVA